MMIEVVICVVAELMGMIASGMQLAGKSGINWVPVVAVVPWA
jgi:hypothetical protein